MPVRIAVLDDYRGVALGARLAALPDLRLLVTTGMAHPSIDLARCP